MDDPLQALREARTLAGKAAATRAIAENAAALRDDLARALTTRDDRFRIDVLNALGASRDPAPSRRSPSTGATPSPSCATPP